MFPSRHVIPSPHRRPRPRAAGNALVIAVIFVAVFSVIVGAAYVLSDETNRHTTRETHFASSQVAADAALDVMYGRFSQWVNSHTGLTPSTTDAATPGIPGNAAFPAIAGAIDFSTTTGLSDYRVTLPANGGFQPLLPDDTVGTDFPGWATWKLSPSTYQGLINKYYTIIPNVYATDQFSNALTYKATVTVSRAVTSSGTLYSDTPLTVNRYFQASQVSPFTYNIFTEGTFEDYDWGQSFDSEANIYASTAILLDHKGTIVNGPMRYGGKFVDPDGHSGGTSDLVFQDPNTGATVDPYTSGLLRQVSKIEVVPEISSIIAQNTNGTRSASAEFATATDDDFSRRELIEPPANLTTGDTAPDQIAQRRIYTQADVRLKISLHTTTVTTGTTTTTVNVATGTFYNVNGVPIAVYTATPSSPTSTSWTLASGGSTVTAGVINAVTINPVNSSTPFYDSSRRYDTSTLYSGQPGQPNSSNTGNAVESVDVNVGSLDTVINNNQSSFTTNTVYIWDDGASGQKNGVRLYNGGILPNNGLTVGSTDPVYVKGDYNTGTVLSSSTDINASTTATQPAANSMGWAGGTMATVDQRVVPGYTLKPAGIFGDTVTTLSQNFRDASSASTQYACSTTFNAVLGFGSGDVNSLLPDDSFSNASYSTVQTLEYWNNCRWNQLGEQMSLYHSIYNLHKNPPAWLNGGWVVIQNDFNANAARLPLKWGYLVFSRGRYIRG